MSRTALAAVNKKPTRANAQWHLLYEFTLPLGGSSEARGGLHTWF
ncbi:MAG TPA: DUF1586 domain-containing protein [Rhodopirellula baltica]|uniref:Uncharacterized protein n=1 Tax=Rhodopirellula baltica (strain DSM 10527 / NCIMB 13988 / SH1) TaxID=243090 RepID=Q7UIM6_RHOBA|nr:hypothetical protein RB12439 [Rhodopirellula baltica SH 1]HBE61556.1 DUF1586 domain-containing protein [Rhodopirellula baltica]